MESTTGGKTPGSIGGRQAAKRDLSLFISAKVFYFGQNTLLSLESDTISKEVCSMS